MSLLPWKVLPAVLGLGLAVALVCSPQPAPAAAAPSQEEIARWVRQLGDQRFTTREKATQQLWSSGQAAEPALQQALKSPDPEVARRAGEILDKNVDAEVTPNLQKVTPQAMELSEKT